MNGRLALALAATVVALTACRTKGDARPRPTAAVRDTPAPVASALATTSASGVTIATDATSAAAATTGAPRASAPAGGPPSQSVTIAAGGPCNLLRGPIQLSFTGQATVWTSDDARPDQDPHIVFNRDGVMHPVTLPPLPPAPASADASGKPDARRPGGKDAAPKKTERLALTEAAEKATAPGCSIAGGSIYCMAVNGTIHRTTLTGDGDKVVAAGRAGTPIATATIAGDQQMLAFLADRKTTEGPVTMAFVALGDGTATQLSEEGSGATFVTLAPRGDQVVAMYIDARRAMTPLHARVVSAESGKLRLGTDAVLFVGEGTEARPIGALALPPSGPAFGLLPTYKDSKTFGIAAIRIDEQPRDDAPVTWSTYPSELERAPIATTRGVSPVHVALVRPASSEPKAKRVLEVGVIDPSGAYKALCSAAESSTFSDVSITADRFGTLWLLYTDAQGTWIERRGKAP